MKLKKESKRRENIQQKMDKWAIVQGRHLNLHRNLFPKVAPYYRLHTFWGIQIMPPHRICGRILVHLCVIYFYYLNLHIN